MLSLHYIMLGPTKNKYLIELFLIKLIPVYHRTFVVTLPYKIHMNLVHNITDDHASSVEIILLNCLHDRLA